MQIPTRPLILSFLALTTVTVAGAAPPEAPHAWCGTNPAKLGVLQARHEAFQRRLERERRQGLIPQKAAPGVFSVGDIVVIEDDGTLVVPPNAFDLHGRGMQFLRRPKGMSVVRTNLGFKQLIGERRALGDDDSTFVQFPAGFEFPFGDEVYTSVWVNSNGNLTFGTAAPFSFPSLDNLSNGPPRLAPLWGDLDPSAASGGNGVYVNFLNGRVRITWLGVPEFNTATSNTVQVTLFETGRVTFVYGDAVEISTAIVGARAFTGDLRVLDYNEELPFRPPERVAIAEEFLDSARRDDLAITQTFFEHYRDVYDHVILWLDFSELLGGAFAFEQNVKNDVRGIGLPTFDFSRFFGSDGRLESFVQMGSLARYPDDPDTVFLGTNTSMGILGQETGHRWLAFVRFIDRDGNVSTDLLGRQLAHWSYFMDSDGSVMEGNDWTERSEGGYISTDRATTVFSELDQYIMGLRAPEEVSGFFYVIPTNSARTPASAPTVGGIVEGERVDVSVNDIIAAEGPRIPTSATAGKVFRMAFLLIGRAGEPVSQDSIDKLERIRARWVDFFLEATDFRGEVRTAPFPK